ncbi:MAG: hypothetical protein MK207_04980 [Saprospiraceae bacterium]|nr:hypothetical protein [Saprospiraceae bacterium]
MSHKLVFFLSTIFFCISSCDNSRSYSLIELENNKFNTLKLRVNPALKAEGFEDIFKELGVMSTQEILNRLKSKNIEINIVSFAFYYLANSYAASGDIDLAIKYHSIAAHNYINPQSLLKLAELNFFKEKDYAIAYEYLHQSLEVTVEITGNNRSHPLSKNAKNKAQYLLDELKKLAQVEAFDIKAVRSKLKKELPGLLDNYREMFELGSRKVM